MERMKRLVEQRLFGDSASDLRYPQEPGRFDEGTEGTKRTIGELKPYEISLEDGRDSMANIVRGSVGDLGFKLNGVRCEGDEIETVTYDKVAYAEVWTAEFLDDWEARTLWGLRKGDGLSQKRREGKALAILLGSDRLVPQKARCYPPVTVCTWADGTVTRARASEGTKYDPTCGIAICVLKKLWGDMLPDGRSPNGELKRLLREDREHRALPIFKSLMRAPGSLRDMVLERLERAGQLRASSRAHATKPKHLRAFAWSMAKGIAEEEEREWGEVKPKKRRKEGSEGE